MKSELSRDELVNEYKLFESANEVQPPIRISNQILEHVRSDFNPSSWLIFSKLFLIHITVGTSTVFFCPQFGFKPMLDVGFMHLFMQFGEIGCKIGCGAIYIGSTALAASLILKQSEIKVLHRTKALQIPLLSFLSVGAFVCFGANIVFEMTLIAWFVGAIFGGLATFELAWLVLKKIQ